jgi:microcystin-dependent protein
MSIPFVGEIRMFGGNFAPAGWMFCDGSVLAISEFETLFNLIGTTYGGDGQSTFALPDLRSRVPIHAGVGFVIGQLGGEETVTLTTTQMPAHGHAALATSSGGTSTSPASAVWATTPELVYHAPAGSPVSMAADSLSLVGGSQPHDNMLPFLAVSFIISLFGVFPSQT